MPRGGRKLVRCGPVKPPEHSPNPLVRGAARIARARARFVNVFGDSASDTDEVCVVSLYFMYFYFIKILLLPLLLLLL